MSPPPVSQTLRRMTGRATSDKASVKPADSAAPDLARAMATGLLRVADTLSGLGLSTRDRNAGVFAGEAAFADLDPQCLCLLLDPPGYTSDMVEHQSSEVMAALTGLIVFDPAMTDGLIEAQTIGKIDGAGRPPRRPTRIDAALAQPFARALLEQIATLMPVDNDGPLPGTLRASSFVSGPASLGLILTAPSYLRLDVDVQLGHGTRPARITLILPHNPAPLAEDGGTLDPEADWKDAMTLVGQNAPVRLEAVLPKLRISLAQLMSLKAGDLLPLDPTSLAQLSLIGGASGVTVKGRRSLPRGASLTARLGQFNGVRAVKIVAMPGEKVDRSADPFGGMQAGGLLPDMERGAQSSAVRAEPSAPSAVPTDPAMSDLDAEDLTANLPDLPEMPDLPPLDDLPSLDADGGLGDLGDLPELGDLPDLGELPKL